jgi:hypothetical protein
LTCAAIRSATCFRKGPANSFICFHANEEPAKKAAPIDGRLALGAVANI